MEKVNWTVKLCFDKHEHVQGHRPLRKHLHIIPVDKHEHVQGHRPLHKHVYIPIHVALVHLSGAHPVIQN